MHKNKDARQGVSAENWCILSGFFLFARIYHRGFQDTVTLEPVWPMRATVLSDAVFEQDRFERLRRLGDDLLLLLGAIQQDIVKVCVGYVIRADQLICQ